MNKLAYQAPALRAHGSVEALTKQSTTGTTLDGTFVAGTPLTEVGLS